MAYTDNPRPRQLVCRSMSRVGGTFGRIFEKGIPLSFEGIAVEIVKAYIR
jgi:hypothetical protein